MFEAFDALVPASCAAPSARLLAAGLIDGLVGSSILALTALGLSLVFGVMRIVNVAHGEFHMLGAVLAWAVATLSASVIGLNATWGFLLALILAPLAVAALAAAADWLVLKRLNYEPEATIVATIGLLYIIQQSALSSFGPVPQPVQEPVYWIAKLPRLVWEDGAIEVKTLIRFSGYKLVVIGASIVMLLGVWFLMARTRFGLVMRATESDREMATAFGIPVDRVFAGVFALGAALAALGAVLIVPAQQAHYLMGGEPLLMSFIVVIIGGLGSLAGTVFAAVLIGMSDGLIGTLCDPTFAKILATLLVALVLVFRPQGLFGKRAA